MRFLEYILQSEALLILVFILLTALVLWGTKIIFRKWPSLSWYIVIIGSLLLVVVGFFIVIVAISNLTYPYHPTSHHNYAFDWLRVAIGAVFFVPSILVILKKQRPALIIFRGILGVGMLGILILMFVLGAQTAQCGFSETPVNAPAHCIQDNKKLGQMVFVLLIPVYLVGLIILRAALTSSQLQKSKITS